MKITRENYEIWFVDWLDNSLSGEEIEELNFFLENNPDLREEFSDLSAIRLKPDVKSFPARDRAKKSTADLSGKQFEILCAASVENDLNEEQQNELDEMISADPEKAITLRIFRKLKLSSPEIYYAGRKKLLRLTPARKVMRIAWIGLSAAAVVSILIMTGVFRNQHQAVITPVVAQNKQVQVPSENTEYSQSPVPEITEAADSAPLIKRKGGTANFGSSGDDRIEPAPAKDQVSAPARIAFAVKPLVTENTENNLVPNTAAFIPPEQIFADIDDGRSNVGRFIARHFRSKILDEEAPSDAPLRGYEIAEAGIDGLNKLLGWEMALTERTDENGTVKSLNFNSRMLKFKTPVKNNSSAE